MIQGKLRRLCEVSEGVTYLIPTETFVTLHCASKSKFRKKFVVRQINPEPRVT